MSFRRRTYPEVLENLLTAATGGVAAEAHPFPPPAGDGARPRHALQQPPVARVSSVFGSRHGEPHLFRDGTDYRLVDGQVVEWQEDAELPDEGTLVHVNYFPAAAQPVLTDVYTGSVFRTLAETVGLEITRLYTTLGEVYRAGFVETAGGSALDNVVALLGIERVRGGHATGLVEFTRSAGVAGVVAIPAGTRIATPDGKVEYETTEAVTLAAGQRTVRVAARDLEEAGSTQAGEGGVLAAGSLTVLPTPIAGIESVTNPAPTTLSTQDETDAELRTRAKNFLHGSERATLGALEHAIRRQGVAADVVDATRDPSLPPGVVRITFLAESIDPDLQQRLDRAIEDARPAGVRVLVAGAQAPAKVDVQLRLSTASGLADADRRALQHRVRGEVEEYFSRLKLRENGSVNQVVARVLALEGVEDLHVVSATVADGAAPRSVLDRQTGVLELAGLPTVLGALQVADPALPTTLTATVHFRAGDAPPDTVALRAALQEALTHLNALNAGEAPSSDAERARRTLTYEKLVHAIPLPGKEAVPLAGQDPVSPAALPPLGRYRPEFVLTLESGLSRILSAPGSAYALTPFERLSLADAEARPEGADA